MRIRGSRFVRSNFCGYKHTVIPPRGGGEAACAHAHRTRDSVGYWSQPLIYFTSLDSAPMSVPARVVNAIRSLLAANVRHLAIKSAGHFNDGRRPLQLPFNYALSRAESRAFVACLTNCRCIRVRANITHIHTQVHTCADTCTHADTRKHIHRHAHTHTHRAHALRDTRV